MVADSRISPVAGLDSSLMQVRRRTLAQGWIQRLTSIWALGIAFVTAFVIAAGPFQQTDLLLATRWLRRIEPDLVWFAHPADSSEPTSASSSTVGVSVVPPPSVSSSMASEPADGASDRIASVPPIRMPAAASRTRIERTRRPRRVRMIRCCAGVVDGTVPPGSAQRAAAQRRRPGSRVMIRLATTPRSRPGGAGLTRRDPQWRVPAPGPTERPPHRTIRTPGRRHVDRRARSEQRPRHRRASARRPSGPLRTAATAPPASRRPGPGRARPPAAGRIALRGLRARRR